MRLFRIPYLLFSLSAILLASCEDVVNLPVDSSPDLVVFSNFSDQNNLEVYVYKTRSILSNEPTEYVKDAVVRVYAGNQLLEELQLVQPDAPQFKSPYYTTVSLSPVFDLEYTIEVKVDGYQTITAKNSIPTPVNLEDVTFDPQVSPGKGDNVMVTFSVSVSLSDPANIENFYHLRFYQELTPFTAISTSDTLFGTTYLAYPSNVDKVDENSPPIKYDNDQSYLIKDVLFDGQYITLNFTGQYSFNPKETVPGRFLVELRTVSKAYFLYHESLNRQYQNGSDVGEGDVVFNNIDNGVGNFSGFTSKVNSFKLTD
jgi:hypothetical protein